MFKAYLQRFIPTYFGLVLVIFSTTAAAQPEGAFISYFNDIGDRSPWFVSNYTHPDDAFRTAWTPRVISRSEFGGINLSLVPTLPEATQTIEAGSEEGTDEANGETETADQPAANLPRPFDGAEIQRRRRTHYGRYEVIMTAARGEGVISSFFTYTGPYFGDEHNEIDFEFLGRDTTKVWINRFADGERLPGRWIDLGFDAADGPQLYTFEWLPDRLVWSVNRTELYRVSSAETVIPTVPQRIYFNIWAGGEWQKDWSGVAPEDMSATATYYCVSYRPPESYAPMCSDKWYTTPNGN